MNMWKLLPVEPTPEMLKAGAHYTSAIHARGFYQDMLAAAPAPDVQPVAWIKKDRSSIEVSIMSSEYMVNLGFEPLYTHPPASDVRELVEALKDILNNCLSSNGLAEAHTKARAALAKWEGK